MHCSQATAHSALPALNFGAIDNLCNLIGKLNRLLSTHPAFSENASVTLMQQGPGNVIAALRSGENIPQLLILLNLDCDNASEIHFRMLHHTGGRDLLTGKYYHFDQTDSHTQICRIAPGDGVCLAFDDFEIPDHMPEREPRKLQLMASEMAQNAALNFTTLPQAAKADGKLLCRDPEKFAEEISGLHPAPLCHWFYPQDTRRVVMAAPGDLLMLHSKVPFIAEIRTAEITLKRTGSLQQDSGEYFALIRLPRRRKMLPEELLLEFTAFDNGKINKSSGNIQLLADPEKRQILVKTMCQDSFVIVHITNYYEAPIEQGLFSTKPDPQDHGLGLQSIKNSVERYNGNVQTEFENGLFSLKILIPYPSNLAV